MRTSAGKVVRCIGGEGKDRSSEEGLGMSCAQSSFRDLEFGAPKVNLTSSRSFSA